MKSEAPRMSRTNILICTPGRLLQHMDQTVHFDAASLQILGIPVSTVFSLRIYALLFFVLIDKFNLLSVRCSELDLAKVKLMKNSTSVLNANYNSIEQFSHAAVLLY